MTNLLWREKYTEAMLELNPVEMPTRIAAAEKAIQQRIEELEHSSEDCEEELWGLNDALRGLRVLAQAECRLPRLTTPDKRQVGEAL